MSQDLLDHAYRTSAPNDLNDPPRFSQISETVKDVIANELKRFFDSISVNRILEIPTIEKYATMGTGLDPYETVVNIVRKNPDIAERLPHIAVLATAGTNVPASLGPPLIGVVQTPPRLLSANPGPYTLVDLDILQVTTASGTSSLTFTDSRFTDITAASAADVVRVINEQALYLFAQKVTIDSLDYVRISCRNSPDSLTIGDGSTTNALTALGFTVDQTNSYLDENNGPKNRYAYAWEIDVDLQILTHDENTRGELVDIVLSYFGFFAENQYFTWLGRSIQDESISDEYYEIFLKAPARSSGEQELPRGDSARNKINVNSISLSLHISQYLDRAVLVPSGPDAGKPWIIKASDISQDETLPLPS